MYDHISRISEGVQNFIDYHGHTTHYIGIYSALATIAHIITWTYTVSRASIQNASHTHTPTVSQARDQTSTNKTTHTQVLIVIHMAALQCCETHVSWAMSKNLLQKVTKYFCTVHEKYKRNRIYFYYSTSIFSISAITKCKIIYVFIVCPFPTDVCRFVATWACMHTT